MSKFSADEVDRMADSLCSHAGCPKDAYMLRDLSSRLRQEEDENRRDPVTDPMPGDRVENQDGTCLIYFAVRKEGEKMHGATNNEVFWRNVCREGATIIRRREVQQ